MTTPLLIVGLDGATFDVLDPLIANGRLPNLSTLISDGFRTPLESTYPPITGPAWTSLATGLNPGNTGAYDFLNRTETDSFELSFINSSYFEGRAFWDYLGPEGIRTGLLNYPMLHPPYETNGFMVSGLGASAKQGITHPPELQHELDRATGGYEVKMPSYADPVYEDNENKFLKELDEMLEMRTMAAEHLVTTKEWDVFFVVFSGSDLMQHYLWKHWDESHPNYDPERSPPYREAFVEAWERLDEAVGELIDAVGSGTDVLVLSDHGFGPQHGCFNVNAWLEREGYLSPSDVTDRSLLSIVEATIEPMIRRVSGRAYTHIRRFVGNQIGASRPSVLDQVDEETTVAVSLGSNHNVAPVFVLDRGRRDEIVAEIEGIVETLNERSELPVTVEVHDASDVYYGSEMELSPDVLLNVSGYEAAVDKRVVEGDIYRDEAYSPNQTGLHRSDGVLIGAGPSFVNAELATEPSLLDIAPTVLYLYGFDPADRLDGTVRTEFLVERVTTDHPGRPLPQPEGQRHGDTEQDEDAVRDQLEDLGYL